MPDGAGSGILHSLTFTPTAAGKLMLRVSCTAAGTDGGDWGSAYKLKGFATQDGSTTYGNPTPASEERLPYTILHQSDVIAGEEVECGLYGEISGAVALVAWDIDIHASVVKR